MALVVASATGAAGCGADEDAEEATGAGEDLMFEVTEDPVYSVGAVEGEPEEEFESIAGVTVWDDSIVGVIDGGPNEVRFFDETEAFLGQVGGEGQGPGELQSVTHSWVEPDGRLGVFDEVQERVTIYGPEEGGEELDFPEEPDTLPETEPETPPDVFRPRGRIGDAWLVSLMELGNFPPEGETFQPRETFSLLRDGDLLGNEGFDIHSVVWYTTAGGDPARLPLDIAPGPSASLNRDLGAVLDYENLRILLIGEGHDWREIPLEERCPPMSEVFLEDSEEGQERRSDIPLEEFRDIVPDCPAPYDRVVVTGDERIWVRLTSDPTMDGEEGDRWKLIDGKGEVLGLARLPSDFIPMDATSDVLYGRWTNDLGVHHLHGYRLPSIANRSDG